MKKRSRSPHFKSKRSNTLLFDWPRSLEETKQRLEKSEFKNDVKSFGLTLDYVAGTVWSNIDGRVRALYDGGKANFNLSKEVGPIRERVARVVRDFQLINTALNWNLAISPDALKQLDLAGQIERLNLLRSTLKLYEGGIVRPIKHSRNNDMLAQLTNFRQWFDELALRKKVKRMSALHFIQSFCAPIAFNNNGSDLEPGYMRLSRKRLLARIRVSSAFFGPNPPPCRSITRQPVGAYPASVSDHYPPPFRG